MPSPLLIREVLYLSINLAAGGGRGATWEATKGRSDRYVQRERDSEPNRSVQTH